jgi:hypothetical protein
VVAHELAVGRHDKDGSQQKRREQAVQNGGPKKGFDRVDIRKVDRDSDQLRTYRKSIFAIIPLSS